MEHIKIYTDGACKGNPGRGGWGVYAEAYAGRNKLELYGGERNTTNNRMELMAVIEALKSLGDARSMVEILTDSSYVSKGISEWIHGWKRKGWKTSTGSPVKNADLWKTLDALAAKHDIKWSWVKGHAGVAGNERADELANLGAAAI